MKELSKYTFLAASSTFVLSLVSPFIVIYFIDNLGIKIGAIGLLFAVQTAARFVSSIPSNWLGDKLMRKPFMILGSLGGAFTFYMLTRVTQVNQIVFILLLSGFFSGLSSVSSGFFANLTKGAKRGKKLGVFGMMTGLAGAAALLIGARAIEMFGFTFMFYIAAVVCIFEAIFLLFISQEETESASDTTSKE
jgi:MFS family permease|tara:strand:- start:45 stop:620 length:576 start_codon:yes stop_codon:yes gene_type:complete